MSDYQRFVSYIYEYQGSKKSKNCGFSRVEVRSHQCRLEIHMKLPVYPFTPVFQVFAFIPAENQTLGISLGNASYHQGAVYGIFTIPDQNINGLSYGIKDLGGLYIQTDNGQFFATAWKEITVQPDSIVNFEETPQVQAASLEEDELLPNYNTGSSENTSAGTPVPPQNTSDSGMTPSKNTTATPVPPQNTSDSGMTLSENTAATPVPPQNSPDSGMTPSENTAAFSGNSARNSPESSIDPWEKIQDTYPHTQPFFDDNIHQCVKLSLKDIPQLNQYGIPVGMNQFLIHGCQSYQHFLLGRPADSGNSEYVLAVPGIYDEKEQFLASMFGFPNFKPAKSNAIRPGQFGYWYRLLY